MSYRNLPLDVVHVLACAAQAALALELKKFLAIRKVGLNPTWTRNEDYDRVRAPPEASGELF